MNKIAFPSIGITLNIDPIAFSIGSKGIYWYALIILSGFLLGLLFVCSTCEKRGVSKDNVWDVALIGLVAGIIGARIYYVLFALDEFDTFADMFKIWNGGLAIYGGIIGAFISTVIYCRVKKISLLKMIDVCAPGLLIGQIIGRFGNFTNAEVYGRATTGLFGMSINGAPPVHPLFLYEAAWNALGLIVLLIFRKKKRADGQVFCLYLLWYSLGRLVLEGMRDTSYILYAIPGIIGISQLASAALILISAALLIYLPKRK